MNGGENEEEAAWLDLIAHYDAPAGASTSGRPWPALHGHCDHVVNSYLRRPAEHPVRYLAELRAELPVVGLGQGT